VEERILILAPRGRDAEVICQILDRAETRCAVCADIDALCTELSLEAGGILVTEEALAGPGLPALLEQLDGQPPWSDIPVIVLATKQVGPRPGAAARVLERLGNVMLLERPINAETLSSAARAALRARRRQYQTRSLLEDQARAGAQLQQLNETLEQRVDERARELDGARETLAFALNSAEMGSWDLDLIRDVSRRATQHDRIFGYATPLRDWGMQTFIAHVHPDDRRVAMAAFEQAEASGVLDLECRIQRADGVIRWVAAKGRVEYEGDRPVRMAGIVMDTTERRQTEDALRQAQKMEAIGQLTGGVAHDFNNLLTVIVGALDMVIRKPDQPERVVRLADAAMTAARRGEQLTQQLLAFSRRQMLRPQTLDPNQLLTAFEPLAARAVGEAVTLHLNLDPDVYPIRIDPAQFEAAVLNLVVNARDAMPSGGAITISSRNVDAAPPEIAEGEPRGPHVLISVTDTGMGMDPVTLARVFEPFFTTKEVGKGSGLGLAQVYGFARSARGGVLIRTEVSGGTSVELYFPRSVEAKTEERQIAQGQPLRRAAAGETVLLVEDDEQVLAMAVESLEELRYKVEVARNAREALDRLAGADRIDVLFSDVVMPGGMNGAQLAIEARRLRPGLKILLTSGYAGEFGADQVVGENLPLLTKPYRRDELAAKLRSVLDVA